MCLAKNPLSQTVLPDFQIKRFVSSSHAILSCAEGELGPPPIITDFPLDVFGPNDSAPLFNWSLRLNRNQQMGALLRFFRGAARAERGQKINGGGCFDILHDCGGYVVALG